MFPPLRATALDTFPVDYREARQNLLFSLEKLRPPFEHEAVQHDAAGAHSEALFTDIVWLGPHDAPNLLVLISATHGAEGFAGAAIQQDVLEQLGNEDLPEGLAVLIIHALNPWGFSHGRRVNEDGIDLNRNGADFSQPLPENSDYRQASPWLVPAGDDWSRADTILQRLQQEWGESRFRRAVSGGQYEDPKGLFYGGRTPSFSRQMVESRFAHWHLKDRQVLVLDVHTGLGPFGHGELICDHPATSIASRKAQQWFGQWVTLPELGDSCSVPLTGLMDYLWHNAMREDGLYLTLEYGTYSLDRLLQALRRDHWLYAHTAHPDFSAPQAASIRKELAEIFNPQSVLWRESVLLRARHVIGVASRRLLEEQIAS